MISTHYTNWLSAHFAFLSNPRRLQQLLTQFKSIETIKQASSIQLQQLGASIKQCHLLKNPNTKWIDEALAWHTASKNHHLITQDSPYPPLLKQVVTHPYLVCYR